MILLLSCCRRAELRQVDALVDEHAGEPPRAHPPREDVLRGARSGQQPRRAVGQLLPHAREVERRGAHAHHTARREGAEK